MNTGVKDIHQHIFGLNGFAIRSVLNLVIVAPDDLLAHFQIQPAKEGHVYVMFLCRTLAIADHEEALRIFQLLFTEDMKVTEPNLPYADWLSRYSHAQRDFENQLNAAEYPLSFRAPQLPFLVAVSNLVSLPDTGLTTYIEPRIEIIAEQSGADKSSEDDSHGPFVPEIP